MEELIEKNYKFPLAGHVWEFNEVRFHRDEKGRLLIAVEETRRINRSVANAICSTDEVLSADEFVFLCRLSRTSNADASKRVKADPSTPTKWMKRGTVPALESEVLKKFFWEKIFGEEIEKDSQRQRRADGADELAQMGKTAIEKKWADAPKRNNAA
jgi:hypothetical protein